MATKLKAQIDAFLLTLGLDGPVEDGTFAVGDAEISVREDPFGRHIVVASIVGELDEDPVRRGRQATEILQLHLGAILTCRAVVSLDPETKSRVVVAASVADGVGLNDRLRLAIEDVATLSARYQPVLADRQPQGVPIDTSYAADFGAAMIFRP